MRWAVLAMGLLLLGGCADQPDAEASVGEVPVADVAARSEPVEQPAAPARQTVADVKQSYENPVPPPDPAQGGHEWTVWEGELPPGYLNLTFEFTRTHLSADVFAPRCRVYHGGSLVDQDAFSDASVGQVASDGTCTIAVTDVSPGTWSAIYSNDALQPGGTHEVGLKVTGWYVPPQDDGVEGRSGRSP